MTGRIAGRRVLIDATGASIGGGYTYLVNVIPRLCGGAPKTEFRLVIRHEGLRDAIPPQANLSVDCLPGGSVPARLAHVFLKMPALAAEWRADLYFAVGEVAPYRMDCPMIASFRNATIFEKKIKQRSRYERLRVGVLKQVSRLAARRCDRVLFVSEDSASWIGELMKIPPRKSVVVPHGIDAAAWSEATPHAHPRPYILTVGSIYFFKNYVRLIEAWAALASEDPATPDLVIIGDEYDVEYREKMARACEALGELGERVSIKGAVPYAEIRSYYAGAEAFVLASYLETFGHPLLEAMAAGIPLVASDIPVFREIAGHAAAYADPMDSADIARALREALGSERAAELVRQGRERIQAFTWDHTATRLIELFADTIESA
ncbi:MAG: hypothetical protein CL910_09290 [Deltaproteobacteria bacterium]|nr:hypothetical protein [Deltaproteobacteria bacterium]